MTPTVTIAVTSAVVAASLNIEAVNGNTITICYGSSPVLQFHNMVRIDYIFIAVSYQ